MEKRDPSQNNKVKKSSKLELPYTNKRDDWGSWIYDNRIGVSVTVVVCLVFAIILVTARIVINRNNTPEGFFVDLQDQPKEKQPELEVTQEQLKMEQLSRESFNDVRNLTSNSNSKLDAGLKDDKGTNASQIYDEAQAMQDRLKSSREAYEKGIKEVQDNITNSKNAAKPGSGDKREDAKQKGRVTVSYSLEGRNSVYLHIPAYQCQGGGQITVVITVNRNGTVTNATLARGSTGDDCLNEMAVKAAFASKFNVSTSAPDKQQGTITYMFIPQ